MSPARAGSFQDPFDRRAGCAGRRLAPRASASQPCDRREDEAGRIVTRPIFFARGRRESCRQDRSRSRVDDTRAAACSRQRREDTQADLGQPICALRIRHQPVIAGKRARFRPEAGPVERGDGRYGRFASCSKSDCTRVTPPEPARAERQERFTAAPAMKMPASRCAREARAEPRATPHEHVGKLGDDGGRELVDLLAGQIERQDCEPVVLNLELEGAHRSSTTTAPPCPPPMHMVARPNCVPRRFISLSSVVTRRLADEPTGCPSAIAPPLTFVFSQSISPIGPPVAYFACQAASGRPRAPTPARRRLR